MSLPLRIGDSYTSEQLNELLSTKAFKSSAGLLYPNWNGRQLIFLRVTLEKSSDAVNSGWDYHDYFDGALFHWDSQTTQDINTPKIQAIVNGNVDIHLICRITTQGNRGKTNPFVYCGELLFNDYVPGTANPVHMSFTCLDLIGDQPENIELLRQWQPFTTQINLLEDSFETKRSTKSQGYSTDPEYKKAIERRAMDVAREHYEDLGFRVSDTSANHPYDFEIRDQDGMKRVEVKGSSGGLREINVTANEVRHARRTDVVTDLALVSGIAFDRVTNLASGGVLTVIENWVPTDHQLTATSYRCVVNSVE